MNELPYKMFFKAFSNKTRFEIIKILKSGPRNVNEIVDETGFEQSRVSHNLRCLENCGFVNKKANGKNKIYELDKKHILPILKEVEKHLKEYNKRLEYCGELKI